MGDEEQDGGLAEMTEEQIDAELQALMGQDEELENHQEVTFKSRVRTSEGLCNVLRCKEMCWSSRNQPLRMFQEMWWPCQAPLRRHQ
jgi:hypothetical protein